MKTRNNDIQLFKFLYAWIIVLFHLKNHMPSVVCPGGSFGVEFYLLSAGLFLFSSYERGVSTGRLQTPGEYFAKRFSRFFAWSTTAFVFAAVVEYGLVPIQSIQKGELLDHFSSDIWEILLIKSNGMNGNRLFLNGPAWTLSSMLIAGFLIWGFLYFFRDRFLELFMPLFLIVGYGFWWHLDDASHQLWIGFTTFGTFRACLVMCLGYYCLRLSSKIAAVNFNKWGEGLLTGAELLLHGFCFLIIFKRGTRYYQWLVTLMMLLSIAIAVSGKSYLVRWTEKSKIVVFLGELSMSVYLVHAPVIELFRWRFDISSWPLWRTLPLLAAIFAAAVIHMYITKFLIKATPKLWKRICSPFKQA